MRSFRPRPRRHAPFAARATAPGVAALFATTALAAILGGCAAPQPTFDDLPAAEILFQEGKDKLEGRRLWGLLPRIDIDGAVESFQAVIDNYPQSDFAPLAELAIADAYFKDTSFDEALAYYRDFADLHPAHAKVPYATLQAARCHVEQISSIERDQTSTREALAYLDKLLREHPYSDESKEGERILYSLRQRLARNVMETGDFYLRRDEYQAAAARFRSVLDEYPGLDLDAEALFKLGLCYEKMRRRDEALRLFHVVLENYANTDIAMLARERISSAD